VDEGLEKRIKELEEQTVASGSTVMATLAELKEDADSFKIDIEKLHKTTEKMEKSVTDERDYTNDKVAAITADLNKQTGELTDKMNEKNDKVYEDMNKKVEDLTNQLNESSEELI